MNRNDPWDNAMKLDIIAAKKHWHWAGRRYLKNQTILSKQQINKAKNYMVKIMHKTKSELYSTEINSATSKKSLFAVCNKLFGLEYFLFSSIYLMNQLPAIFSYLFNEYTLTN